jgi:hypothetical protein
MMMMADSYTHAHTHTHTHPETHHVQKHKHIRTDVRKYSHTPTCADARRH